MRSFLHYSLNSNRREEKNFRTFVTILGSLHNSIELAKGNDKVSPYDLIGPVPDLNFRKIIE